MLREFESHRFRQITMTNRTLHVYGTASIDAEAVVTVDNNIVHQGNVVGPILFTFTTSVTKHGSVSICIKMLNGSLTVTHNRAVYPARINGEHGTVDMPQPIIQPNLPFVVDNELTYNHYMFNGPKQWIISVVDNSKEIVVDDFYQAVVSGFMRPDWQYDYCPVDIENLTYVSLV